MNKLIFLVLMSSIVFSCSQSTGELSDSDGGMPLPMELSGPMYSDIAKEGLENLLSKNIDAFIENFSENAIYRFNNLDSISGKEAIRAYWDNRMTNVIDKLEVSNDVWLPIKVNESDKIRTGEWVLNWARVNATYINGNSMTQWVHTVYHFNEEGQIDLVTHFLDTALIKAATYQ